MADLSEIFLKLLFLFSICDFIFFDIRDCIDDEKPLGVVSILSCFPLEVKTKMSSH